MANSVIREDEKERYVVNCFQISNFVLWQTAASKFENSASALWIAFKLVILSYGKQPCLTSKKERPVVNCFQISNFVLWQTADRSFSRLCETLWIAFKLVILSYGKQHMEDKRYVESVVNCFQISNFVLWQTAASKFENSAFTLWIAFKLVILSYGKQPDDKSTSWWWVVNCFQISNFVLWQTAFFVATSNTSRLWIAFKLVILSYGKQHPWPNSHHRSSCELLSN